MLPDRFLSKIQIPADPSGCWLWTGYVRRDGYGTLGKMRAHRATYIAFRGPIPEGLELDHLCRVRHCVNPDHLEAVTHRVNTMRGIRVAPWNRGANNARKTQCPYGHPFDDVNTYWARQTNGRRARKCRECRRAYRARVALRARAA